jgi:hypothetical protein
VKLRRLLRKMRAVPQHCVAGVVAALARVPVLGAGRRALKKGRSGARAWRKLTANATVLAATSVPFPPSLLLSQFPPPQ